MYESCLVVLCLVYMLYLQSKNVNGFPAVHLVSKPYDARALCRTLYRIPKIQ